MGFVVLLIVAIYGLQWLFNDLTPAAKSKDSGAGNHTEPPRGPSPAAGKPSTPPRHHRSRERYSVHCEEIDADGDDDIDELEYMRHFFR